MPAGGASDTSAKSPPRRGEPTRGKHVMKKVWVGIIVIALALGLVGCKSIEDKIGEEIGEGIVGAATGSDVEVTDDGVTIETEDGDVTISDDTGEIPDGFPSDFPLYDGYELDGASSMSGGGQTSYYINMTSEDPVEDVYNWYKGEFTDNGWNISGDALYTDSNGSSGMLTADKGDLEATVTVTVEGDGTYFGVILVVTD